MKEIFNDFVNGNATTKLSIISNISTILGVSVATFVAGPFLSKFAEMEFIVSDFIIAITFYFIYLWLAASTIYFSTKELVNSARNRNTSDIITKTIQLLLIAWAAIVIFPHAKYYTGNIFNTSYLLPPPAKKAISGLSKIKVYENNSNITVQGEIIFNEGMNGSDYELVLYKKNDAGVYTPVEMSNREDSFRLSQNGQFTMPFDTRYNKINDPALVIYRTADWSLTTYMTSQQGYPEGMTQLPSSEMDALNAYVFFLKNKPIHIK